ncbi:HET domain protein [Cordyceps militaris CM01]|uniref:HET domain protein n=1 Tax=Cordyceps militaris (strain CM01) TaxID=983644 RepID=G3J9S6_CORMM|nr:HET domain protein [Cordyceps militaris CM01]EGX94999.1 HET domain protein [Cordyceps militaris CM01]
MKLVHAHSRTVVDLPDGALPPYAVLSHTRDAADQKPSVGSADTTNTPPHYSPYPVSSAPPYTSYTLGHRAPPAALLFPVDKLEQACEHACRSGLDYIWIADLCIDKTSTADLDDAVNGSRRRLCNAAVCLAFLHDLDVTTTANDRDDDDLSSSSAAAWARCRYWQRAWTLQELVLAPRVRFYDRQWNYRGDKDSPVLAPLVARITGIPRRVLLDSTALSDVALAMRFAWSARRAAARDEDTAYALVALTEATLPVRYGEGATRAFLRLQEELLRDTRDGSLLAWRSAREGDVRGLLARSPAEFGHFAPAPAKAKEELPLQRPWVFNGKIRFSNKGIEIESRARQGPGYVLLSIGQKRQDVGTGSSVAVCFREWNGVYVRVTCASRVSALALPSWRSIDVMRDVDPCDAVSLRSLFNRLPYHIDVAGHQGCYEDAWRGGSLVPRVAPGSAQGLRQQRLDQDKDMRLDEDEAMLVLSPQTSHTPPSNHSEGSYINIAMTGSWMGSQEEQHQHPNLHLDKHKNKHQPAAHQTHDDDIYSDAGIEDDALFSADSDPGSLTSHSASASASVTESDWGDDHGPDSNDHHNFFLARASGSEGDDDADTMATETRSTTTLTAEGDHGGETTELIMQPSIRDQIFQISLERVLVRVDLAPYEELPTNCVTPAARDGKAQRYAVPHETTTSPRGYYHLSCPFYVVDPEMHSSCVLDGHDLNSIPDVFQHLRDVHERRALDRPVCARCHCVFDDFDKRDAHAQLRACPIAGPSALHTIVARKGVSRLRVDEMELNDRVVHGRVRSCDEDEAERWGRIFVAIFGHDLPVGCADWYLRNNKRCVDPYLRSGNRLAVSKLHDFWVEHGDECIADGFTAAGFDLKTLSADNAPTEDDLDALYSATLLRLIAKIYHEYGRTGPQT